MIHLKTERLVIRDFLPKDINDWHRLSSDPETMYFLQDVMTRSLEESRRNMEMAVSEAQNPNRTKYFFAIEHGETGTFIGTIGYTVTETTPAGKLAGAGYWMLPEYHGQGYMTEALREVIRFGFQDDNVFRFHTGCLAENRASERVMQKCGFVKEAQRKSCAWHDGRMKDRVEYRLLKAEWESAQSAKGVEPSVADFWDALDRLVRESELAIDRPKGSAHPRYPDFIYPLDYGYLKGTSAMDGGGIDFWRGSKPAGKIDAIMCTVDLAKRDAEIKLLMDCAEEEMAQIWQAHNETPFMKGILIRRDGRSFLHA